MEEEIIQKKSDAARQSAILVSALERAIQHDGVLLNGTMKQAPCFYEKNLRVNPSNALIMAMHSDLGNYKTNSYVLFNDTKNRGEAIRKGQKGVPFVWTNTSGYVNKDYPEDKISRADFRKLSEPEQARYKPNSKEDIYMVFNIDQTTMPNVHKEDYDKHLSQYGGIDGEGQQDSYLDKNDKVRRMKVNQFILRMRDNLVPVRKDATGIAHYDGKEDVVFIPSQKNYSSYGNYVQEVVRQIVHATGISGRLNREGGTQQKEALVEELASAAKMLDFGMPAKLRPETVKELPSIIAQLKGNSQFAADVLHDVNRTVGMIKKAEKGEKIQVIENPSEKRREQWLAQFPMEQVPEKFSAVVMLKDDEGKWTLAAKPESAPVFAVHPTKEDIHLYFDIVKNSYDASHVQEFRAQMAQKYYAEVSRNPEAAVHLFHSDASQEAIDLISNASVFKINDSKIFLVATIGDEKQKPVAVSQEQWQRFWLADDKQGYKTHLAAILYSDVLAGKIGAMKQATSSQMDGISFHEEQEQEDSQRQKVQKVDYKNEKEEQRRHSPEQEEKERQEEKAKEEATKAETKAVAAVAFSPMMKQFAHLKREYPDAILLFRVGNFYEAYQQDARRISDVLGIPLTQDSLHKGTDGKPVEKVGFPLDALETYLIKLIQVDERVAICGQLEKPKTTQQSESESTNPSKQASKDHLVTSVPKQEEQQNRGVHR